MGVDLSAEADRTVVACLDWSASGAVLNTLTLRADDDAIVDMLLRADKAGIDCPFGWPDEFIDFVVAHRGGRVVAPEEVAGREWRRRLAFRQTDEAVRARTGVVPLSVATNLLGLTAMRCASLLARVAGLGRPVDRSGEGAIVEVYPAASLHQWGYPSRGYKGSANAGVLAQLVADLQQRERWLDLNGYQDICSRNDDAFDAVVAAITARAAALGRTFPPNDAEQIAARTEGWVALPNTLLSELIS